MKTAHKSPRNAQPQALNPQRLNEKLAVINADRATMDAESAQAPVPAPDLPRIEHAGESPRTTFDEAWKAISQAYKLTAEIENEENSREVEELRDELNNVQTFLEQLAATLGTVVVAEWADIGAT